MAGRRGTGRVVPEQPRPRDVFEWLDEVRERPGMYFRSLLELEAMLFGYATALDVHSVDAGVWLHNRHFDRWLRWKTGWSLACGWARAITLHSRSEEEAARRFFELLDEFRQLRPTVRARVRLKKHHQATGTRCVIGVDGLLNAPRVIEVIQYAPAPLFFLRFHYPRHRVDRHLLFDNGREDTSLTFAKQWVRDEFGVSRDEWE